MYKGIIRKERIRKNCFQIRGIIYVSQGDKDKRETEKVNYPHKEGIIRGEEKMNMEEEEEEKIIRRYLLLVELYCKQYLILLELMTLDQKEELEKKIKEVYTLMHDGFLL